jgi:hypothetical protein
MAGATLTAAALEAPSLSVEVLHAAARRMKGTTKRERFIPAPSSSSHACVIVAKCRTIS